MLKTAILGLRHGKEYIKEIERHPETSLAAVIDKDRDLLDESFGNDIKKYDSIESFAKVESANIDIAIIALPTQFHLPATEICLEAGMHILLEKPLCRNDSEAEQIRKIVNDSDRVVQIGYEVRSSELNLDILRQIASGEMGQITNIWYNQITDSHYDKDSWRNRRSEMGGLLFDCAVHYLDLIQQWAGAPVCRLCAFGNTLGQTGPCSEDIPATSSIILEYSNGVRSSFNFTEASRTYGASNFGLCGTEGAIMGDPYFPEGAGSYKLYSGRGRIRRDVIMSGKFNSKGHLGFSEQFDNFVETVEGKRRNICSVEDALCIHRMMKAVDESISTGCIVELSF